MTICAKMVCKQCGSSHGAVCTDNIDQLPEAIRNGVGRFPDMVLFEYTHGEAPIHRALCVECVDAYRAHLQDLYETNA